MNWTWVLYTENIWPAPLHPWEFVYSRYTSGPFGQDSTSNWKQSPIQLPLQNLVYVLFRHYRVLRHWKWSCCMTLRLPCQYRHFSKASNGRKEHTSTGKGSVRQGLDNPQQTGSVKRKAGGRGLLKKNSAAEVNHCYDLHSGNKWKRVKREKQIEMRARQKGANGKTFPIRRNRLRSALGQEESILKYTLLCVCVWILKWWHSCTH